MSKTAKYTLILIMTTLLSKILGAVRDLSVAYRYGAGDVTDAYFVAFAIPTVLFAGIGSAILTSFIPMYTQIQKDHPF